MNDTSHRINHPMLPIKGKKINFPVTRIFGVGRNYSQHRETENKSDIVLFMKDAHQLSHINDGIQYPFDTTQLRYEIELVVAIGKKGSNIDENDVNEYIYGYAVGIDFTKYDIQDKAKKNGHPWDQGKSFEGCAPCSQITPKKFFDPKDNVIWLNKNDIKVQNGKLNQMIYSIPSIISIVSKSFGLLPGDLIFTGTPQGTGMVSKNDILDGGIDNLEKFSLEIK